MTAEQKFDARIKELGIWDRWCSIGQLGRIGAETENNIIVLVHESDDDAYSEFTFPTIKTMQVDEEFRDRALAEFVDAGDEKFIRELVWWWIDPTNKCPLYPEDVYFIWAEHTCKDFEDDAEQDDATHEPTEEYCPHCDSYVELAGELKVQKCPNCGKWIVPCTLCPPTDCLQGYCSAKCPLERLAIILNK